MAFKESDEYRTFNAVVVTFSDFSESYPDLTREELEKVWLHAKRKMQDYFMQDYQQIMDIMVDNVTKGDYQ
jgi:hypothetical protein|tara:strand:- start:1773 stop:1985 length:213 start_codon:yes stop_codon:yes gene_type:complete